MSYIFNKENYDLAKMNGDLELFRSDEISHRIEKRGYPLSSQVALLMDAEEKPEELSVYKAVRKEVKAEVDEEIKLFEK